MRFFRLILSSSSESDELSVKCFFLLSRFGLVDDESVSELAVVSLAESGVPGFRRGGVGLLECRLLSFILSSSLGFLEVLMKNQKSYII